MDKPIERWEAVIEFRAAIAIRVIEKMADDALLAHGFTKQYVNRRRGQLRRHSQGRKK